MLGPELDSRLIQLLTQNARLSNSELSRRLGVSRSTIQSRIERLEQTGVIQGYTLKLNPKSEKNVVQAHVSISVAPKLQAAVERNLLIAPVSTVRTKRAMAWNLSMAIIQITE